MAFSVEVLLLVTLISNSIHDEIIKRAGKVHSFGLDYTADFYSLSRWTGDGEKKLLWNSSDASDSYWISKVKVSDSGLYQQLYWTRGLATLERNTTLLVCDDRKMTARIMYLVVGQTVELTCDGAAPNQSVQWAMEYHNPKTKHLQLALLDDETSLAYEHQLVNNSALLLTVDRPLHIISYLCLDRTQQSCDLLREFLVDVESDVIYRWVGESLELNCSDSSGNQPHIWMLFNSLTNGEVSHNYTLMFPSLTLSHTGRYICAYTEFYREFHDLFVCPESVPPAISFFTGRENVTLECGDGTRIDAIHWFMRSNRTKGRCSRVHDHHQQDGIYRSGTSLVITNVTQEDSVEFRCVVLEDSHCVFTSETLVIYGEPEVDHHLVRSVLLSIVIVIMFLVVVACVWRTTSRQQLPAPVEEVEMSRLTPAPADQPFEIQV